MNERKPCPFCGERPWNMENGNGTWVIQCLNPDCEMTVKTIPRTTEEMAIDAWNRRS